MNTRKLADCQGYRMRLWPVPRLMRTDAVELARKNDDWIVDQAGPRGIVRLKNTRTGHVAVGTDCIHHFEHEPQRDWDGLRHGLLVLSGAGCLLPAASHFGVGPNACVPCARPRSHVVIHLERSSWNM